jgi:hypothetical protein
MMEAVRISETSFYSNETTGRYITEDSHLHTRRRENLKAHRLYKRTELPNMLFEVTLYIKKTAAF